MIIGLGTAKILQVAPNTVPAVLPDIGNIPLKDFDGVSIRVKDVANVSFGAEIRQGAVTVTQRDSAGNPQAVGEVVAGIVLKRLGANTNATFIEGFNGHFIAFAHFT